MRSDSETFINAPARLDRSYITGALDSSISLLEADFSLILLRRDSTKGARRISQFGWDEGNFGGASVSRDSLMFKRKIIKISPKRMADGHEDEYKSWTFSSSVSEY